jgi:hypothetical protein
MSWPLIWVASSVGGAVFGWLFGPVPLDFAVQLLIAVANAGSDRDS